MKQYTYNATPPYPINKWDEEFFFYGVCWLLVEDTNKKIDFREDLLWFDINYATGAQTRGSIRGYMGLKENFGNHIFSFKVEYYCPFKLVIESDDGFDLTGLKVTTKKIIVKQR